MDTTTISKYVFTVNLIGQRTSLAQTGAAFATAKSVEWGYDPLGQVTSANSSESTQDRAYQYDTIGNRQKSAESLTLPAANNYTANTLNQYTTVNTDNPTYDQDGNTLTEGNKNHTWDAENRLIKVQIGEIEVTYQYDSQSRRIQKTVHQHGTDPNNESQITNNFFLYDGWNNIAEYKLHNSTFILHNSYSWGLDLSNTLQGAGGVGGLLSVTKFPLPLGAGQGEGVTHYVSYDGNGNISEYLDEEGTTAAHFEYDPFGNTTVNTDTENNFPYRFSTKPLDFTTNLYYFGFRDYEAPTGRWKTRDPIEEEGGVNLYGFVGNDVVNRIDILGLLEKIQIDSGVAGVNPYIIDTEGCSKEQRELLKDALSRYLEDVHRMTMLMEGVMNPTMDNYDLRRTRNHINKWYRLRGGYPQLRSHRVVISQLQEIAGAIRRKHKKYKIICRKCDEGTLGETRLPSYLNKEPDIIISFEAFKDGEQQVYETLVHEFSHAVLSLEDLGYYAYDSFESGETLPKYKKHPEDELEYELNTNKSLRNADTLANFATKFPFPGPYRWRNTVLVDAIGEEEPSGSNE